ncbi:hypothetical protein [Streptomyces sp. NPDC087437]|uniref:hypothetical protein n=1 Tax=Streptomyces sp. NPDC087437 TaxID=3365789 RepID=UPI0038150D3D
MWKPSIERLRRLPDAFTAAADQACATMNLYADREDTDGPNPVCEDGQRAHHPQESAPRPGGRLLIAHQASPWRSWMHIRT